MAINDDLLNEVSTTLTGAITPSLTTVSATSDLFEAYTLSILLRAAQQENATIAYRDPTDSPTTDFVFRTSPGYLWSSTHSYTFALIEFPDVEPLEAHVGVRVSGKSGVLHELDVCVIRRSEALISRASQVHPRHSKVIIGVECKFYTSALSLGLARSFVGLGVDMTAKNTFFVTNASSPSVERLLSATDRNWGNLVSPGATMEVDRQQHEFQTVFKHYKAR